MTRKHGGKSVSSPTNPLRPRVQQAPPGPRDEAAIRIRHAVAADLEVVTQIYNEAILTTTATFDTEPYTAAERLPWFQAHGGRHPILVAELDGRLVGWASLSKWSERPAYNDTAETSFYVKSEARGRGIGRQLKAALIDEATQLNFHTLIARVAVGSRRVFISIGASGSTTSAR
jgi:phosphinothricin acetyltransferase